MSCSRFFLNTFFLVLFLFAQKNSNAQNYFAGVEVKGNKWSLINEKGESLTKEEYYTHLDPLSDGLAAARDGGLWGYLGTDGKLAIPLFYYKAGAFSCGIAPVSKTQGEFYYINKKGNVVCPGPFNTALPCSDSMFFAKKEFDLSFRLYDVNGKMISTDYKEVFPFKNGYAVVRSSDGGWQIINKKAEVLFEDKKCSHIISFSDGMFAFRSGGKWGFIDSTFKVSIQPIYNAYTSFNEGYARVELGGKWMLIDKTGTPAQWSQGFDNIGKYSNGMLAVKNKDGFWGYVNSKGEVIVKHLYLNARQYKEGRALVKNKSELWGYLNKSGEWVVNPSLTGGKDSKNGFLLVRDKNDKWSYRTADGTVINGLYEHVHYFEKISGDNNGEGDE